jgi:sulfide:quinone oxidoreductase
MPKTVVVLGAGVGGLSTASRLRELLEDEDRVILVDRSFEGVLGLSLLWVLRGWRSAEEVRVHPTQDALPGIEMVTAETEAIDLDRRVVTTDAGELPYDALVIALGAAVNPGRVPGLQEALDKGVASEFYSLEGAEDLHAKLQDLETGRLVFLVAGVPFKCPAAPFEAAFLAADLLRSRGVGDEVTIDAFTPDPFPMPVAGPVVGNALVEMLHTHDIGFHPNKTVERIDLDSQEVVFADGAREKFDLLAVVPPHEPSPAVASTGLGPAGWIPVDARTLATKADGVWALGDATVITLPNGKPLPKAAVFAEGEAEVVATGVARYLGRDAPETRFAGDGACYVEVGDRQAAKGAGNFLEPPAPAVTLQPPSQQFHQEKVDQEADWLERWNR